MYLRMFTINALSSCSDAGCCTWHNMEYIIFTIWLAIPFSLCAVPFRSECTLYPDAPHIQCLTASNVASHVANSPNLWLVEFYSSSCGHCISFAPRYLKLSNQVKNWKKFIRLAVLDCAPSINRATCQEFKVHSFPSFKSIPPFSDVNGEKVPLSRRDLPSLTNLLIDLVVENKHKYSEEISAYIQQLEPLHCDVDSDSVFESSRDVCVLLIVEQTGSYAGKQIMLDVADQLMYRNDLKVRRLITSELNDCPLLPNPHETREIPQLIFFRDATPTLQYISNRDDVRAHYTSIIANLMTSSESVFALTDIQLETAMLVTDSDTSLELGDDGIDQGLESGEVLFNRIRHGFTTSDVINSVSYSLRSEVSLKEKISGEDITALLSYLKLLSHILPQLHPKTTSVLSPLIQELTGFESSPNHVVSHSLTGREWDLLVTEKLDKSIFPVNPRWVGCRGSKPYLRGYTCGMWVLFHLSLTRASLETDLGGSELSAVAVAVILRDYVVRFFSCADCKFHFGRMSARLEKFLETDRDAVLWFWIAHNKINERLRDDPSTDVTAPKVQFPPLDLCPMCRFSAPILNSSPEVFSLNGVTWNTTEVYTFLLTYYSREIDRNRGKKLDTGAHLVPLCYFVFAFVCLLLILFIRKICHRKQKIMGRFKQY